MSCVYHPKIINIRGNRKGEAVKANTDRCNKWQGMSSLSVQGNRTLFAVMAVHNRPADYYVDTIADVVELKSLRLKLRKLDENKIWYNSLYIVAYEKDESKRIKNQQIFDAIEWEMKWSPETKVMWIN